MKDLIEAFTIFAKYGDVYCPTHCEHDVLYVFPAVDYDQFSAEDADRLSDLGFFFNEEGGEGFMSYRFGSC